MHRKLFHNIYEVDVAYPELKNTFASYVILGDRIVIIDPGPVNFHENLVNALESIGVSQRDHIYIALTHIHPDHYGAASKLVKEFCNAKILAHPRSIKHLMNVDYLWDSAKKVLGAIANIFGKPDPITEDRIIELRDSMLIEISDNSLMRVIFTPGHATHHVSYFLENERIMFLGDSGGLYINDSLAPTTPFPFNYDKAIRSIMKMLGFQPEYVAYTHFGMHNDATKKLLEYMGQLYLWFNICKQNCTDSKEFLKEILRVDHETNEFLNKNKDNPVLSGAVMHSIYGFIKYLEYIQEKT